MSSPTESNDRLQLHLVHPYKQPPREHPLVRRHLEQGYRVEAFQRLTDREMLVTLARRAPA